MSEIWTYFCILSLADLDPLKLVSVENLLHGLHKITPGAFRPS